MNPLFCMKCKYQLYDTGYDGYFDIFFALWIARSSVEFPSSNIGGSLLGNKGRVRYSR